MKNSKAQIIATIGPASANLDTLTNLVNVGVDVIRFNFSWGNVQERIDQIKLIKELEEKSGKHIPVIIDLPGPRIQESNSHTYNHEAVSAITEQDEDFVKFAASYKNDIDYIAISFVSGPDDIKKCRELIKSAGGTQKIIAKIERAAALNSIDQIITEADAIMVARGDLGNEVPLEQIPFIQNDLINKSKKAGKPVIVATGLLISMVENPTPARAEVTDVTNAIIQGADAVMLSDETARGKYPIEAAGAMAKIISESEEHLPANFSINPL